MKAAELNTEMVFQTTKSARSARSTAAVIVDVETAWSLGNRDTWSRNPECLRPYESGTSRGQRYLPVVAWDGWAPDEDTRTAMLREAADLVRPLLVDGAEVGDLGRAVADGVDRVGAENGANGRPRFAMLRPQDIECLRSDWLAYQERVRVNRERQETAAAEERTRQLAARDRLAPLVADAGLKLDRLATYDGESVRLSWTQLERIVLARPEQWSA